MTATLLLAHDILCYDFIRVEGGKRVFLCKVRNMNLRTDIYPRTTRGVDNNDGMSSKTLIELESIKGEEKKNQYKNPFMRLRLIEL